MTDMPEQLCNVLHVGSYAIAVHLLRTVLRLEVGEGVEIMLLDPPRKLDGIWYPFLSRPPHSHFVLGQQLHQNQTWKQFDWPPSFGVAFALFALNFCRRERLASNQVVSTENLQNRQKVPEWG